MCLRLITRNVYLSASLGASPSIPSLSSTQSLLRGIVAVSTSNTSQVITATWPTTEDVDAFYLPISTDNDVLIELFSAANQVGMVHSMVLPRGPRIPAGVWRAGIDPFGAYDSLYTAYRPCYFDAVSARSMRITITSAAPLVKTISWILLGKSFQPAYGASIGMQLVLRDNAQLRRTRGGSLVRLGGAAKWRECSLDLQHLSKVERIALWSQLAANTYGVLLDALPTDNSGLRDQLTMLSQIGTPEMTHDGAFHSTKLTFEEI